MGANPFGRAEELRKDDEHMRKVRITVSIRPDLVAQAKAAVAAGEAASVSAWVNDAMEERGGADDFRVLLDELLAESPPTEEDRRWVRRVLET